MPREWTNDIEDIRDNPDGHYYLPWVIAHEFGHLPGLTDEPNYRRSVMYAYSNKVLEANYPTFILTTMFRYSRILRESHPLSIGANDV